MAALQSVSDITCMCEWVSCDSRREWNEKEESGVGQASKATEKEEALSGGQWPLFVSLDPLLRPTPRPPHAVPGQQIDVRSKGRLMQEISREEISPSHARSRRIYSSTSAALLFLSLAPRPPKVTMRKFFLLSSPSLCLLIVLESVSKVASPVGWKEFSSSKVSRASSSHVASLVMW